MPRPSYVFKRSYNAALDHIAPPAQDMLNVSSLAKAVDVSRTTSRRILEKLCVGGFVQKTPDSSYRIISRPEAEDYFPDEETLSTIEQLETKFMDWILTKRMGPGSTINEAKFAHEMGISNTSAREFLLKLSRFGFLRKEPYKTWSLEGVSDEYADEIMEVRLLFETSAVARLARKDDNDPFWNDLNRIRKKHETLIAHLEHGAIEMPGLDAEFHNLLNAAAGRRLILAIQDVISMIFHYHYHHIWKEEQRLAMAALALQDHIEIIDAIQTKNEELARERMQKHLSNARYALKRPPYRFMTPAIQTHTPHDTRSEG